MNKGKIIQVMGPDVDVAFEGDLPKIKDALHVAKPWVWRLLSKSVRAL